MAPLIQISALDGMSGQLYALLALPCKKAQGIHQIGGRVGTRAGRRDIHLVPLPRIELRFVGSRNHSPVTVNSVGNCASGH